MASSFLTVRYPDGVDDVTTISPPLGGFHWMCLLPVHWLTVQPAFLTSLAGLSNAAGILIPLRMDFVLMTGPGQPE